MIVRAFRRHPFYSCLVNAIDNNKKIMKNKQAIATMVTVQEEKECARNALAMIGHPENLSLLALHNHNFLSFAHEKIRKNMKRSVFP